MHEMSKPIFLEKKKNFINLSSAEFAHRVVMVNNQGLIKTNVMHVKSVPYVI